jgi:hypothetical protein
MNNDQIFQNAMQSVDDAEGAVIQAQGYSCPEYLQKADQQIKLAYQQVHEAQKLIDATNVEQIKQLHLKKERLIHLQENQNSLL